MNGFMRFSRAANKIGATLQVKEVGCQELLLRYQLLQKPAVI